MFAVLAYQSWPWYSTREGMKSETFEKNLRASLIYAAMGCICRPTNAVTWIIAASLLFLFSKNKHLISKNIFLVGIPAFFVMLVIDRIGYKEWCIPLINFYRFNLEKNLAVWFGESNMFYHIFITIPVLFTTMVPLVFYGIYLGSKTLKNKSAINSPLKNSAFGNCEPAIVALGTLVVYSFAGHKEYRFLFSLLPIGFTYAGVSLNTFYGPPDIFTHLNKLFRGHFVIYNPLITNLQGQQHYSFKKSIVIGGSVSNFGRGSYKKKKGRFSHLIPSKRTTILILALTNIPIGLFTNLLHARGVVDVMRYLRKNTANGKVTDIGFLMPCHSTPFYSHIHKPVPMWFLTCDPPQNKEDLISHYWEANEFDINPENFIKSNFVSRDSNLVTSISFTDEGSNVEITKPKLLKFYNDTAMGDDDRLMVEVYRKSRNLRYLPSHLVFYSSMLPRIHSILKFNDYIECANFYNTLFETDIRRKGNILVYCKN
ncbi:GPI mannosyltransferase 3 [Smittium mucronatum]|uniref:Mannosyltransferase n=1 Tax=Smittium mucronatum TaxID=133383 RepID=A0A1R0H4X4_9FUNG|nr:GPI mannosyltransferase 3 [Smittium mucronatum]